MIVGKAGRRLGDLIHCWSRERKEREREGKESGDCEGEGKEEEEEGIVD